jgi:hypothetical protein
MKDKDVLCSLGVSDARLKELIKAKAASNCDATATTMGITSDSLRALLDPKALMHDDAINRFYDLLEEDRKSSGQPLWAVGVPLMQALESGINGEKMLQDYIKSREANTQGDSNKCVAMELVQGDCIMAVHVPGHYIFIRVDHDRGRVEVADPLGLGITRTRGEQATRVQNWFQAQVLRLKLPQRPYSIVCNPESNLPRQTDSVSCGPFVCAYAFFVAMNGRYPTNDDFTCANKSALRYFIMHYLLVHPVQDNATKAAATSASSAEVHAQNHFCTDCGRAFSTKFNAGQCNCGTGPGSGGVRAGSGRVRAGAGSGGGGVRAGAGSGGVRAGAGRPWKCPWQTQFTHVEYFETKGRRA